jgi:hypothetical protein
MADRETVRVAGVSTTHPRKVWWPDEGLTKLGLVSCEKKDGLKAASGAGFDRVSLVELSPAEPGTVCNRRAHVWARSAASVS